MTKNLILISFIILYIYYYSSKPISLLKLITIFKTKGLFFRGTAGMSNNILGYYSSVYLSILMKRYFRMNYISKIEKYYKIPHIFFTNKSFSHFYNVNEINITMQYKLLENKTDIVLYTNHDILENIIPLCKLNITKCLYINIRKENYIHEVYKLRKKLITEFLIPKRILFNIYNNFKKDRTVFVVGIHIRTSIYSDFKEYSNLFYNSETEEKYYSAISYVLNKYKKKKKRLYIISDSSRIKYKFKKKYSKYVYKTFYNNITISHNINDISIIEQYILSKCNVIIGSCGSTYTLLSVFRYLHEYYAIEGVKYHSRGRIKGKCAYKLDYNHFLFSKLLLNTSE